MAENEIRISPDVTLKIHPDSLFGFEFFTFRSAEMVQEMNLFLKYAKGKKCFFDCGAYMGIFSMVFTELNKDGIAYAFEPFQEPFNILHLNTKDNARIRIADAALSHNSGKTKLYTGDGHLNSFSKYPDSKEVWVNSITGDAFCFGCSPNISPDIIKIDTEGNELWVLLGLQNVIAKHRPTIFLELHLSQLSQHELIKIMQIIGHFGYKIIDCNTDREIPLSDLQEQKQGEKRIILM